VQAPLSRVEWAPSYRIVPSRFPPIQLFERVAVAEDLDALFHIEAMTNDRLRDEAGELALVPPEERISGPGTSCIMAAFTHLNPSGDRFTDGSYGVYYCSGDLKTAIEETKFHRAQFLSCTKERALEIDMRVYLSDLLAELHDIRGLAADFPQLYHPSDYTASQAFAAPLRAQGAWGIAYDSVRRAGGQCAAVFRPKAFPQGSTRCRQSLHLTYVWDGSRISEVFEKRALDL
jgi:hypothetical protein